MDKELKGKIISVIDDVDDMTIATIREDGYPQATTVSYINDGMSIYFGTSNQSQKAKNIAKNDKVSLTVDRDFDTWDNINSVSIGGRASLVTDPKEMEKVGALLMEKFPQIPQYTDTEANVGDLAMFRIDPEIVSYLDYREGFGHSELVQI